MNPKIDETGQTADPLHPEAKPTLTFSTIPLVIERPRRSFPAIRASERGENTLSTKSFRIGEVSIKQAGKDRWHIRNLDPQTQRDVRWRLAGLGEREAHAVAVHINHELLLKGGYLPSGKPTLPSIGEMLAEAIKLRNTIESTRRDRTQRSMKFVRWLAQNHPGATRWDELRPATIQAYAVELERRGLSFYTIRLDLAPVKLAWRYANENWPELVRPLPRLRLKTPPRQTIEGLEGHEVRVLLDWLRDNEPEFLPLATLAGLAGLRQLEIVALRGEDVILEKGNLTVTETPCHRPKTRESRRTIPLCSEALTALRCAMKVQRMIPSGGEVFPNTRGEFWRRVSLSHRWTRILRRAARETGLPRLAQVPIRKLRAAFTTMVSRLGAPDRRSAPTSGIVGVTSWDSTTGRWTLLN